MVEKNRILLENGWVIEVIITYNKMRDEISKLEKVAVENLKNEFEKKYGRSAEGLFFSPGRVNIIGEHVDYHEGLVMPAAINLGMTWAVARNGGEIRGYSEKFDEIAQFDISSDKRSEHEWLQYLQGVTQILRKREKNFDGIDFAVHSTIPIGSGLSSSSSLATGFAFILNEINGLGLNRREVAKVACEAEWWYGTTGGIMDQYCIANGKMGNAIMLDCRTLEHEYIKIPEDIEIVVFETTIRHKQIDSPFALRKEQARKVLQIAKSYYKNQDISSLRDISPEMLDEIKPVIIDELGQQEGEMCYRRSRHPISENGRVLKMKDALNNSDYGQIGDLLYACHESLRDDYEVSCPELDMAVEVGKKIRGIIGSRMVGGGFGGCTINLVNKGRAQHFAGEIEEKFRKKTGIKGNSYICHASDGARKIDL